MRIWQKSMISLARSASIKNFMQRNEFELYDLIADPDEIKNLASNPEYTGILDDLKSKLKGFQVKTNDPWVIF